MATKKVYLKPDDVLDALRRFIIRKERSPSYEELAEWLGVTPPTVWRHVKTLKADGRVLDAGPKTIRPADSPQRQYLQLLQTIANIAHWSEAGGATIVLEPAIADKLKEFKAT